ncbi:hypothetical protein CHS0354_043114 [Potamilus streckersoni]|uniref:Uncharacterized protein n=1 Tax=Potamilus streckersoni TaxID=2493646 RepID=A0AAE0VTZ4_9BIVA|nr:hypothetical protein CHS0354_043114 [Potamilus streckersoni]
MGKIGTGKIASRYGGNSGCPVSQPHFAHTKCDDTKTERRKKTTHGQAHSSTDRIYIDKSESDVDKSKLEEDEGLCNVCEAKVFTEGLPHTKQDYMLLNARFEKYQKYTDSEQKQ